MAVAQTVIVGLNEAGEPVRIPPGSVLTFQSQPKDWRRVRVRWKKDSLFISAAAWQSCSDQEDKTPNRERLMAFAAK